MWDAVDRAPVQSATTAMTAEHVVNAEQEEDATAVSAVSVVNVPSVRHANPAKDNVRDSVRDKPTQSQPKPANNASHAPRVSHAHRVRTAPICDSHAKPKLPHKRRKL